MRVTPNSRPTRSRGVISRGRTRVVANAIGTPWPSRTSRIISPRSNARRSAASDGSAMSGCTTSAMYAAGSPPASTRRETWRDLGLGGQLELAPHLGADRAHPRSRRRGTPSFTPRRRASIEYGSRRSRPSTNAVGRRDAADERAAALAADDLAALLQALQRGAQRAARDAEHRREVVLGRQPVARPVAAGREPVAQRLLGAVDQRRPALGGRAGYRVHLLGDRERVLARGRGPADGVGARASRGSPRPARLISTSRAAARDAPSASIAPVTESPLEVEVADARGLGRQLGDARAPPRRSPAAPPRRRTARPRAWRRARVAARASASRRSRARRPRRRPRPARAGGGAGPSRSRRTSAIRWWTPAYFGRASVKLAAISTRPAARAPRPRPRSIRRRAPAAGRPPRRAGRAATGRRTPPRGPPCAGP